MSYKNLEIWQLARKLSIAIHNMTLTDLPKFEQFETGQQIRRSIKSVRANIVEGYGRRRYKQDYIKFLVHAMGSADETFDHLEVLWETKSLTDEDKYTKLRSDLDLLGKKLNKFIQSVNEFHISEK